MYWQLDCVGIEEDEDLARALLAYGVQNGKVYQAYTKGWCYINYWYEDIQLSIHIRQSVEDKKAEVMGSDLHIVGDKCYKLKVIEKLEPEDAEDLLECRILACPAEGEEGMFVVNIVNSDIIPCMIEGTIIPVQMVAKALSLHAYSDEDEYHQKTSVPFHSQAINNDEESKITAAIGSLLPIGFMNMHAVTDDDKKDQTDIDTVEESRMVLTGTIDCFREQEFILDREKGLTSTVDCAIVNTDALGKIQVYYDFSTLPDDEIEKLKSGAIIQASVILSGDVLLNDSKTDLPLSEKNNYALIADVFEYPTRFERLWNAMAENCVYRSDGSKTELHGRENILHYLQERKELIKDTKLRYHSFFAIIKETASNLSHCVGEHCVVFSQGENKDYIAIAFLEIDDNNYIQEIYLSEESGYHFKTVSYEEWIQ